jgi:hypothetical protein
MCVLAVLIAAVSSALAGPDADKDERQKVATAYCKAAVERDSETLSTLMGSHYVKEAIEKFGSREGWINATRTDDWIPAGSERWEMTEEPVTDGRFIIKITFADEGNKPTGGVDLRFIQEQGKWKIETILQHPLEEGGE